MRKHLTRSKLHKELRKEEIDDLVNNATKRDYKEKKEERENAQTLKRNLNRLGFPDLTSLMREFRRRLSSMDERDLDSSRIDHHRILEQQVNQARTLIEISNSVTDTARLRLGLQELINRRRLQAGTVVSYLQSLKNFMMVMSRSKIAQEKQNRAEELKDTADAISRWKRNRSERKRKRKDCQRDKFRKLP